MRKLAIAILMLGCAVMNAQVQERFKQSDNKTQSADSTSSTQAPQANVGQEDESFWDRVLIGGNASVSLGSYTAIFVAPTFAYRLSDKWIAGVGYNYMYFKWNQAYDPVRNQYVKIDGYESVIHGPKALVNFFPIDMLYLGLQFEYLNHDVATGSVGGPVEFNNEWTPVLFLEGGLRQEIGKKGIIQLGLKYNVLHDYDSPYSSPFFPVIGFLF